MGFPGPSEGKEMFYQAISVKKRQLSPNDSHSGLSANSFYSDYSYTSGISASSQNAQTRKASLKGVSQAPIYNVQINEDISLVERIGQAINSISNNYNPYCPLCVKYIDLKKSNYQNVSAYYSKATKRHYLTHFDCYYKSSATSTWRIRSLSELPEAKIAPCDTHPQNEIATLVRSDKKIMLVSLESTHPIGGTMLFKLEKYAFALEDTVAGNFAFFYDLEKNAPCLYEPNLYLISVPEFIIKMVIGIPQVIEDSIILEFSANISSILSGADTNPKNYEIAYLNNGYQINIGISSLIDPNQELINSLNIKLPWFEASNTGDHTRNRIAIIKYIKVIIPNTKKARVETRKVTTSSSLSNIRIDEDEEFDLANSPVVRNQRKKNPNMKDTAIPINFEDHLLLENGDRGRTFTSIESPMTNKSKNILSFSSFSPSSLTEASFLNRGSTQFSQFSSYAIQTQTPSALTLNKANSNDMHDPQAAEKMDISNSLADIDESTKNSSQIRSRDFPKSLSFLPNYESEDPRDSSLNAQQWKLEDFIGQLDELAENPSKSKMIENFIPRASPLELEIIINEVTPHLSNIMLDPYSNCMLLKLLQHCSPEKRLFLLKTIAPSIPAVAKHKKGTHSLQSILALVKGDEEERLIEQSLQDSVFELCKDAYGTHFIQKLVTTFSMPRIIFVFNVVVCYFLEIAQHIHGLCVLKSLITRLEKDQDRKRLIIQLMARYLEELIQNAYGNYAIQHAFDVYSDENKEIWDKLIPKATQFCNQKYSSNVIEKCLETSTSEHRKKFVEVIARSDRLLDLMTNKYGNFVLLKIYSVAEEHDKKSLLIAILRQLERIHSAKYRAKWTSFVEDCKKTAKFDLSQFEKPLNSKNLRVPTSNQRVQAQDSHRKKQQNMEKYSSDSDNDPNDEIYNNMIETNASPLTSGNKKKLTLKKSSQSFQGVNTTGTVDYSQKFLQQQQQQYNQFSAAPFVSKVDTRFMQSVFNAPMMNTSQNWNSFPGFTSFQPSTQTYPTFIPMETNQYAQNVNYEYQNQAGNQFPQYLPDYKNY